MKGRLFISYKTGAVLSRTARDLRKILEGKNYEKVWLDDELLGGQNWNEGIYTALSQADVVVLVLSAAAGGSDWIRREVDTARAMKIGVLPVLIEPFKAPDADGKGGFDPNAVLDKFDMPRNQYVEFLTGEDHEIDAIVKSINELIPNTHQAQEQWIEQYYNRNKKQAAETDKEARTYRYTSKKHGEHETRIYLATGNMFEMRGIDVFVNTENHYMQMARVFESATVSSLLRYEGALIKNGYVKEDTVQNQLNDQLRTDDYDIPIGEGWVIPTYAGHPQSNLVTRNKARFIFHASTVKVDRYTPKKPLIPLKPPAIKPAVINCLEMVQKIDAKKGDLTPTGFNWQRVDLDGDGKYRPLESVIFPIFGTGHAGLPIAEAIPFMLKGVQQYLRDNPSITLKKIHICVYAEEDLPEVQAQFDAIFEAI